MAAITYLWNPFQERADNIIHGEVIRAEAVNSRKEVLLRAGPFFSKDFVLLKQGSTAPLVLGVDYVFAHPFNRFVTKYKRNVWGSIVLLKPYDALLYATYSTIGGPFVLDETAFGEALANVLNAPRQADWGDVIDIPAAFPPDPHTHPATQTMDWEEMMTALNSLIILMTADVGFTVKQLLQEHLDKPLIEAHLAKKGDLGLDLVANMGPATVADLAGNSPNVVITMAIMKEALRRLSAGTLNIN